MEGYSEDRNLFYLSRSLADRFVTKSAIEIGNDYHKKGCLINMFMILLQRYYEKLGQYEKNDFVEKVKEFNDNISAKNDNEVVNGFFKLFTYNISASKIKDPIYFYITKRFDFRGAMLSDVFAKLLPLGCDKHKEWHFFYDLFNELVGFSKDNKIYNSVKEQISAVKNQKVNKKVQKVKNYSNVINHNNSQKYIINNQSDHPYGNLMNNANSNNNQLPQYFILNNNEHGNNISRNSNPNYINILSYNDNQNYIYNGNYVPNTYNNQNIMNNIQNNQHQNQQVHNNNQINNGNNIWSSQLFLDTEHPIDSEYCGEEDEKDEKSKEAENNDYTSKYNLENNSVKNIKK